MKVGLKQATLASTSSNMQLWECYHITDKSMIKKIVLLVGPGAAVRQVAAQGFAALVQIAHFGRVVRWLVVGQLGQLAVGHGDAEAVAHVAHAFIVKLLGLVDGVLAFAVLAHAVTLDGFHQQHGGLAFMVVLPG